MPKPQQLAPLEDLPQRYFPERIISRSLSSYKHLGKAGSRAYLDTVEQVARRALIESLQPAIETLKLGLSDLTEEASKYT